MKKCRYIPEASLPPSASPEQREILLKAFRHGRVRVTGKAMNSLTGVWQMSPDVFVNAILGHLESGRRVFQKCEKAGLRVLPNKFQASVWISEPDDDNDYDDGTVYVELIVTETEEIFICNAHEHEDCGRGSRLPN